MYESTIIEHPFFDDFLRAFQAASPRKLDAEVRQKLKELECALFPSSWLGRRWTGWEIGIPRPPELVPNKCWTYTNSTRPCSSVISSSALKEVSSTAITQLWSKNSVKGLKAE